MQKAASVYLQTQVTTTTQGDIVVMLYDGVIKFLNQAKDFLAKNDMAKKGICISKALDILNELDSTLNMEKGGEISINLHNLYQFCTGHLLKANIKKDPAMLDDVSKIISGLRDAYAAILTDPEAQAAAQEAATTMRTASTPQSRSQSGTSPSGGAAPAPGASARIRAMHAQQARLNAEQAATKAATTDPDSSGAVPTPSSPAQVAAPTPSSPTRVAAPVEVTPAPKPAGPSEHTGTSMPGYPTPSGFGSMKAKTELYRKFSGQ